MGDSEVQQSQGRGIGGHQMPFPTSATTAQQAGPCVPSIEAILIRKPREGPTRSRNATDIAWGPSRESAGCLLSSFIDTGFP